MLILSRRHGEVIRIGDDIEVTIVRIGPVAVRVGIKAPKSINIVRSELVKARNEQLDRPAARRDMVGRDGD